MGANAADRLVKTKRMGSIKSLQTHGLCSSGIETILWRRDCASNFRVQAICCQRSGILWDFAALYPSGVQWGNAAPVYFGGAVVDVAPEVTRNLSALR